jgi:(S)-citramalyl-CoA lyase
MARSNRQQAILSLKSWLFTPATKPERFTRATEVCADALIVDLEDAVAPSAKEQAREAALQYLEAQGSDHIPCALRINSPATRAGLGDIQALLDSSAEPDYIILPKCDSSAAIHLVHSLLREAGKHTNIMALIETARGIAALKDIAGARPAALLFGAADMAADLGAVPAWEPLLWCRSSIVHAAAGAEIAVLDSPFFEFADSDGLKREATASARLGFTGKCAIHPAQVATLNEVFTPSAEEVRRARQILAINQQGVGSVDHQMVDEAVARRARLILSRAGIAIGV